MNTQPENPGRRFSGYLVWSHDTLLLTHPPGVLWGLIWAWGVAGMLEAVQTNSCSSENDFRRGEVKGDICLSIHIHVCQEGSCCVHLDIFCTCPVNKSNFR